MIDSHCHLHLIEATLQPTDSKAWRQTLVQQLKAAGLTRVLNVSVEMEHALLTAWHSEFPDFIDWSYGLHPNHPIEREPDEADFVTVGQTATGLVAIGETGLDFCRTSVDPKVQKERFRCQIRAAKALHKPLIVHTREARQDTLTLLKEERAETVGGVIHCFTESLDFALEAMALNFYISFSGIVTFKNASDLQAIAKTLPLERLLIETDAPYLSPMPYRGQVNLPSRIDQVADKIAELRDYPKELLLQKTDENYGRLFGLRKLNPF